MSALVFGAAFLGAAFLTVAAFLAPAAFLAGVFFLVAVVLVFGAAFLLADVAFLVAACSKEHDLYACCQGAGKLLLCN